LVIKNVIPDPIHGSIEMPQWLVPIINEKQVRRMMFIRQLGLKAYIDYPGAIHTRYSHVLGVMHLSGRVVDKLIELENSKGNSEIVKNLKENKTNIMAAGFLHDIGHGPFSHVVDYILKKYANRSHELIAKDIIKSFKIIEDYGPTINSITQIIEKKHNHPFIREIIDGPHDVDKLDYLLRDAHHVGLRYSFDLDHFIGNFRILGTDSSTLSQCDLGLENSAESIVAAEIFVVIWKSMYDLVYHVQNSRIAEKMMEKAIILKIKDSKEFKKNFTDIKKFVELDDEILFEKLKAGKGKAAKFANGIRDNKLHELITDDRLKTPTFMMGTSFLGKLKNSEELSDFLSRKLCTELKCDRYDAIVDIVKSREPHNIQINKEYQGEPIELKSRSKIISSIKSEIKIKTYLDNKLTKKIDKKLIRSLLRDIVKEIG